MSGYLGQTVSSINRQHVGFTGTNSIQSHPPTHRIVHWLLMIFITCIMILIVVFARGIVTVATSWTEVQCSVQLEVAYV